MCSKRRPYADGVRKLTAQVCPICNHLVILTHPCPLRKCRKIQQNNACIRCYRWVSIMLCFGPTERRTGRLWKTRGGGNEANAGRSKRTAADNLTRAVMFPSQNRPPIRALLLDLSGTLHVGSSPTHKAVHALARLRNIASHANENRRIPFRFCSNTSKEGRAELEHRLTSMGFELQHPPTSDASGKGREMWTSLGALSSHLRSKGLKRPYCLLEQSSRDEVLRDLKGSDSCQHGQSYSLHTCGLYKVILLERIRFRRRRPCTIAFLIRAPQHCLSCSLVFVASQASDCDPQGQIHSHSLRWRIERCQVQHQAQ